VERIQGQIDEPICAHDEQSQGANQVDRPAHAASPVNASVETKTTLVGAISRYTPRLGSRNFTRNLRSYRYVSIKFPQNLVSTHARRSETKFWACHPLVEANAKGARHDAQLGARSSPANKQQTNNAPVLISVRVFV
jgi:hypothetical protein